MRLVSSALAILTIIAWGIFHFEYHAGVFSHLLLVTAITALVIQWIPGKNKFKKDEYR